MGDINDELNDRYRNSMGTYKGDNLQPKAAICLTEQLSFDLISVDSLEAEIKKLRQDNEIAQKTVMSYRGQGSMDRKEIKGYRGLLRMCYRLFNPPISMKPEESDRLRNDVIQELLMRNLT